MPEDVAQLGEYSPNMCKALGSIPSTTDGWTQWHVPVAPGPQEVKTEGPEVQDTFLLLSEFQGQPGP